jgi:hypothetical protein
MNIHAIMNTLCYIRKFSLKTIRRCYLYSYSSGGSRIHRKGGWGLIISILSFSFSFFLFLVFFLSLPFSPSLPLFFLSLPSSSTVCAGVEGGGGGGRAPSPPSDLPLVILNTARENTWFLRVNCINGPRTWHIVSLGSPNSENQQKHVL